MADSSTGKTTYDARLLKLNGHLFLGLYLTKVEDAAMKVNAWAGFSRVIEPFFAKTASTGS